MSEQVRTIEQVDADGVLLRKRTVFDMMDDEAQYVAVMRALQEDAQYGDLTDEQRAEFERYIAEELEHLGTSIEEKIEAALRIYRELEVEWAKLDAQTRHIDGLLKKARASRVANERHQASIRGYMETVLDAKGVEKFKGQAGTVSFSHRKPKITVAWQEGFDEVDQADLAQGCCKAFCTVTATIPNLTIEEYKMLKRFAKNRDLSPMSTIVQLNGQKILDYVASLERGEYGPDASWDADPVSKCVAITAESGRSLVVRL